MIPPSLFNMTIENKFEVIRNENEHETNELHKLCELYKFYIENEIPPKEARQYIKWLWKYQVEQKPD